MYKTGRERPANGDLFQLEALRKKLRQMYGRDIIQCVETVQR